MKQAKQRILQTRHPRTMMIMLMMVMMMMAMVVMMKHEDRGYRSPLVGGSHAGHG